MNRIVREHYPVAELPDDLKEGFAPGSAVRIIVEPAMPNPDRVFSIDELFAMRRPPFKTTEEIVEEVRRMRDERDD